MPVRSDGRLDRETCLSWVAGSHSISSGSDKGAARAQALAAETSKTKAKAKGASSRPSRAPRSAPLEAPASPQRPALPRAYASADLCTDAEDRAAVLGMMCLTYRAPSLVAPLAVMLGIKPSLAYHLTSLVRIALLQEVEDVLAEMGIKPRDLLWEPEAFREVAWSALAKEAGEPVNVEAWKTAMLRRYRISQS
ncbi:hypothetical protein M446_1154 [Methylobacterium sp. 4-46]|nr:hypothetical protein M446_1154 [Methylobacterium sp. 4-46]